MKNLILLSLLIILISSPLISKELTKSDWQHVSYPAAAYLLSAQSLPLIGFDLKSSEEISLAAVMLANIGKEYYDYRNNGVSNLQDLELTIIGIATSYYLNKALNHFLRPSSHNNRRRHP
jgi:hypothetical protein